MTEQDPKAQTDDADQGPPAARRIDPKLLEILVCPLTKEPRSMTPSARS